MNSFVKKAKAWCLSLLCCSVLLAGAAGLTTEAQASSNLQMRSVLVYTGSNQPEYKTEDIVNLSKGADHFIIVTTKTTATSADVTDFANQANKIVAANPQAKLWISTPSRNSTSSASTYDASITGFLDAVKKAVGQANWDKHVKGVYINFENIYLDGPDTGTKYTGANWTKTLQSNMNDNTVVKTMRSIKQWAKNNGSLNVAWAPYVTPHNDQLKRLAYVINENIADVVLLQPHYYFDGNKVPLLVVDKSITNGYLSYTDGKPIIPANDSYIKLRSANIGVDMEIDGDASKPDRYNLYKEYETTFRKHSNKPFTYYMGSATQMNYKSYAGKQLWEHLVEFYISL
ncbi:hypothetical protein YDYSG_13810 [Paenibacillus tyrfis]|uniref:hypothetical protein n=1 Tax=Paenibacillus tyrfis TaxID=1501230 RepID=UPI002493C66F|nr:hypothetical protein [Paenibacillus tyrfis]GLI05351.1 hypothetical protein YDYSG_13810 [Paenibacillus tyrfis]